MKKIFINALVETVLFDEKDIISTSSIIESTPGETVESTPYESTVFVPGSDGFHGEDIPLN